MPNPKQEQYSSGVEGYRTIPALDYVPFVGGMDTYHQIEQLPMAAASNITNVRPKRPGYQKRPGCSKINTTADGSNKVMSAYMFSKGKQAELHTYAQMDDGDIKELAVNPPTTTATAIGTTMFTSQSPSTMLPASWAVRDDTLLYADGTGYPKIYAGSGEKVSAFIVLKGTDVHPVIPKQGEDYTEQVIDSSQSTYANVSSLSTYDPDDDAIYIKTETPAASFSLYFDASVNATAAAIKLYYYNGAFTEVTALSDGTDSSPSGTTFSKDGTLSWTATTDHIPHYMFGQVGYWYRLVLSSGSLTNPTHITKVRYASLWADIQNCWDGVPVPAIEAFVYINSTATYQFYAASSVDIGGVTSADKIYFNCQSPAIAAYISVGSVPNETASTTVTIKYWNGTDWTAVSGMSDGTSVSSKGLASDGWVTWTHPTAEQPTMFQSSEYFSYWYELTVNQTLTADMTVSFELMPYLEMLSYGKCYSLCTFKQRIAYAFEELPGYIAISSAINPMCLDTNSSDFAIKDIGDGRANRVICMKRFYNELLVWQEEKGTEGGTLTLVEGTTPMNFGIRILSTKHGTMSAKSAVVVEDVPSQSNLSMDASGNISQVPSNATVAFFISRDGVYQTNGKTVNRISANIHNYFDPNDADCIRRGYETEHWLDYDPTYQVLRMGLCTGSSATAANTFFIYDIYSGDWMFDSLAQPLSCHCNVEASTGQYPALQIGGGTADGTIYLLNSGTTDAGTAITPSVTLEFDGRGHRLHLKELNLVMSGSCTVTMYEDGVAKTAISIP